MTEDLSNAEKRQRATHLRLLADHPGWEQVLDELATREQRAVDRMVRGGLSHEDYAAAAAEARAMRAIASWPLKQANDLNPPREEHHA